MKYDFTRPLTDLDGNPLERPGGQGGEWSMAEAIIGAVMTPPMAPVSYDENYRRFKIASNIKASPEAAELDVRDVETVKSCVAAVFGPVVVGPVGVKLDSASG